MKINPSCPNPDCDKNGFLRDGPWGNNVECPQCQEYDKTVNEYFSWMLQAQERAPSAEKSKDLESLSELRAAISIQYSWDRRALTNEEAKELKSRIEELEKEIKEIKTDANISPANSAIQKVIQKASQLYLSAWAVTIRSIKWIQKQAKRPFSWALAKARPFCVRLVYRMMVDKTQFVSRGYEILVRYEPTPIGKLFRRRQIVQGYRKTIDGWTAFPFGSSWGHQYCDLAPSMARFLQKQYLSDRLSEIVKAAERLRSS